MCADAGVRASFGMAGGVGIRVRVVGKKWVWESRVYGCVLLSEFVVWCFF